MRTDEWSADVARVAVRLVPTRMDSLVLDHGYLLAIRHVSKPRHALPVRRIGFERGIVSMCADNVGRAGLWLQRNPDALASTGAIFAVM